MIHKNKPLAFIKVSLLAGTFLFASANFSPVSAGDASNAWTSQVGAGVISAISGAIVPWLTFIEGNTAETAEAVEMGASQNDTNFKALMAQNATLADQSKKMDAAAIAAGIKINNNIRFQRNPTTDPCVIATTLSLQQKASLAAQALIGKGADGTPKSGVARAMDKLRRNETPSGKSQVYTPTVFQARVSAFRLRTQETYGRSLSFNDLFHIGQKLDDGKGGFTSKVLSPEDAEELLVSYFPPSAVAPKNISNPSPGLSAWQNAEVSRMGFRKAAQDQAINSFSELFPIDGLKEQALALTSDSPVQLLTPEEQSADKISLASYCRIRRAYYNGPAVLLKLTPATSETELKSYDIMRQAARDCHTPEEVSDIIEQSVAKHARNISDPPNPGDITITPAK